ncbi:hypothetical protein IT409_00445, partial [Candidatus Falkowbacteria bacterium]|nr:hypothetical protein [Candidatus Falkowbacteria bacterium]
MPEVGSLLRRILSLISQKLASFRYGASMAQLRSKSLQTRNKTLIPNWSQLKYIPKVLEETEKKIIKFALGAIAVSCGFLVISFFFFDTQLAPAFGGEYREGLVGRPLYINPLLSQTNDVDADLARLVFNGLVRYDASYNIIPDLAQSWEISEDLKSYTFTIRQGVKWHDGQDFTVNDVFFTYQLIKDKTFKSPLNISFEGVTAEISGENQITFTLVEPYSGFINLMTVGILPQHLWFDIPSANAALAKYNQKPIGTGPYIFKTLTKESNGSIVSYEFESNQNYHLKKPYIKTLIFKFYQDATLAVDALINKQVDGLGFLSKDKSSSVKSRQATIHNIQITQFTAVFFNKAKNALLGDSKVIQALTLATNKDAIVSDVLRGQGTTLAGPILPGFPGYDENLKDEYNPVKAAEILTADGWGMTKLRLNEDGSVYKQPETLAEGEVMPEEIDVLAKKNTP